MADTPSLETKASQRILNIGELRDEILQHLPAKDLLRLQRVNKSWQHSVLTTSSIDFRNECFFDITPTLGAAPCEDPRLNELILSVGDECSCHFPDVKLGNDVNLGFIYVPNDRHDQYSERDENVMIFDIDEKGMRAQLPGPSRFNMYLIESFANTEIKVRQYEGENDEGRWQELALDVKTGTLGEMTQIAQKLRLWAEGKRQGFGDGVPTYEKPTSREWRKFFTKDERKQLLGAPHTTWV